MCKGSRVKGVVHSLDILSDSCRSSPTNPVSGCLRLPWNIWKCANICERWFWETEIFTSSVFPCFVPWLVVANPVLTKVSFSHLRTGQRHCQSKSRAIVLGHGRSSQWFWDVNISQHRNCPTEAWRVSRFWRSRAALEKIWFLIQSTGFLQ